LEWQDIVIRLVLSIAAGMVIGTERERNQRPAGIKTHILVCMGATLVSLMQVHMSLDVLKLAGASSELAAVVKSDSGRLGAQVISGIGFLGAGTIIRNRGNVRGLTTAATLWMVACVGLAIGMGYYVMSIVAVALVLFMLTSLKLIQRFIRNRVGEKILELKFINKHNIMEQLQDYFYSCNVEIRQIEMIDAMVPDDDEGGSPVIYECQYTIVLPRNLPLQTVITEISTNFDVFSVRECV
jgi:putative Mg2+ transporter-C (MgtC) family protein